MLSGAAGHIVQRPVMRTKPAQQMAFKFAMRRGPRHGVSGESDLIIKTFAGGAKLQPSAGEFSYDLV
jgi:hypothetical protein